MIDLVWRARKSDRSWVEAQERRIFGPSLAWTLSRGDIVYLVPGKAYLVCRHSRGGIWEIISFAVLPEFRGCGFARKLLNYVLGQAAWKDSCFRIVLQVDAKNSQAIRLYESMEFVVTDYLKNFYGRGRHGFEMMYFGG